MKKTRKNMLRSSAAMLLVSALALTTATYAWFTTGHSGQVSQLTLTANNDSGIQLSADAENWKGTITLDELKAQTGTTVYTEDTTTKKLVLSPRSSTAKASEDGKLTLYSATTQEKEITASDGTTTYENVVVTGSGSTGNIVKFDLYARNTGTSAKDLILDGASAVTGVADSTTGIENAIRGICL
jgi:hypothetical protein